MIRLSLALIQQKQVIRLPNESHSIGEVGLARSNSENIEVE